MTPAGHELSTLWLSAAIVAVAVLITVVGLVVPVRGLPPFWGRVLDLAEAAVLLTPVPLCLAVLDVFTAAGSLAGG